MPTNSSAPQSSGALAGAPHAKSPARHSRPGLELGVAAPGPHTSPETPPPGRLGDTRCTRITSSIFFGRKKSKLHEEKYRPMQLGETRGSEDRNDFSVSPDMCLEPSAWSGHLHARRGGVVGGPEPLHSQIHRRTLLFLNPACALGLDVFPPEGAQGEE